MKLRLLIFTVIVFLLAALPTLSQDSAVNRVSFNGFSFSFAPSLGTSVNILQYPGDPVTQEQPGGPEAPHLQFNLYSNPPAPSFYESPVSVRVYRAADLAAYPQYQSRLQELQTLLAERPDPAAFMTYAEADMSAAELPFLPVLAAAQVIRARVQYVQTPALTGISYVTVYRQDASPFVSNDFQYTFQGVSTDGAYYVAATSKLTTTLFPDQPGADFNPETFMNEIVDYMNESIATLNAATSVDFRPSLGALDALVQSFAIDGAAVVSPAPEATPETSDTTFGGLGGQTWTLVSYGPADAPIAALPNAPITLDFTVQGMTGSAGCNNYFGIFEYEGNTLSISGVGSTMMACDQPIMDQETAYLTALQSAQSFQIVDGQLQITYDGGVLTFATAQPAAS